MNRNSTFNPVPCAFIGSLLLSAMAIYLAEDPGRDGILYVETAKIFLDDGLSAARARFDWVFLSVCIAFFSKLTGLGLEASGYLLNALLMAGTCATLVRITQIQFPSAAWYACLAVFMLPHFNNQRDCIIREFGSWFFCLQALLAALRWQQCPGYGRGLIVQGLLAVSCLFRIEGAVFFASLALWPLFGDFPWKRRLWRMATLLSVPAAAASVLAVLLLAGRFDLGGRIAGYLSIANPLHLFARFNAAASRFGELVLNHYSSEYAKSILFFGLLSMAFKKFLLSHGILLVPCAVFFWKKELRGRLAEWRPQSCFFIVYAVTLLIFVTYHLFISARYIILLNLLATPLIALGLQEMFERHGRWRNAFLLIAAIAALSCVISTSPRKTQFREAGAWIAAQPGMPGKIYMDSERIAYHAGEIFWENRRDASRPASLEKAISDDRFDYIAVELPKRDSVEKIEALGFTEERRFASASGDPVVIFRRIDPAAAVNP